MFEIQLLLYNLEKYHILRDLQIREEVNAIDFRSFRDNKIQIHEVEVIGISTFDNQVSYLDIFEIQNVWLSLVDSKIFSIFIDYFFIEFKKTLYRLLDCLKDPFYVLKNMVLLNGVHIMERQNNHLHKSIETMEWTFWRNFSSLFILNSFNFFFLSMTFTPR